MKSKRRKLNAYNNNLTQEETEYVKKYLCEICHKTFSWCNDLRKHLRIHTNERPFVCLKCKRAFRQSGCLKNHIASQHGTDISFICYYCNKSFPIKERLRLHMRIHSGEKPYKCSICSKAFARGGQMAQHMVSHFGLRKYRACDCPKSVLNHLTLESTMAEPYAEHFFCSKHDVHRKLFQCPDCDTNFALHSNLKVHQRSHTGERPFNCQVCHKSFAHSSVLKVHVRKHTGEKPYNCFICLDKGFAFSQMPHLKNHMRIIHKLDKAYLCNFCRQFFKTKQELQHHRIGCTGGCATATSEDCTNIFNTELSKLRLLVAILFKRITSDERLKQLGFDKRLIDNVLINALESGGQSYCSDPVISEIDKLKVNVERFLKWTMPDNDLNLFDRQDKSIDLLLEEITNSVFRQE